MKTAFERHIRVQEFAHRSGYAIPTIRKKIANGEILFRKVGRILAIPESELARLMGGLHKAVAPRGEGSK